jgi:PEGA domain
VAVIHTRMFAVVGAMTALSFATPALAGQASRRATNATQPAQTTEPERQAVRREAAPPVAAPTRPQEQQASRPSGPGQSGGGSRDDGRRTEGRAVPRPPAVVVQPPVLPSQGARPPLPSPPRNYRDHRTVVVGPWRGPHPPRHNARFSRPYFTFTPRVRLSIGLTIGHPVMYPVWYDPYPVYGRSLGSRYGGITFDMEPYDAAVFIDGDYVGIVDEFSPYEAPLTLRAGRHRVEIRARGFQPMDFDITVVAGQVIPYRGALAYDGR